MRIVADELEYAWHIVFITTNFLNFVDCRELWVIFFNHLIGFSKVGFD